MIDLGPDIKTALSNIDGLNVYYFYPSDWTTLPVASFYEINNSDYAQADGEEYLSDVVFQVDIWSNDPDVNAAKSLEVDEELTGIRLRREFSQDLFETGSKLHHRTMRYGCVAKQNGTVYQK